MNNKEVRLIYLVEKYKPLYDKSDKEFKDGVKKELIWRHISSEMNMSGKLNNIFQLKQADEVDLQYFVEHLGTYLGST